MDARAIYNAMHAQARQHRAQLTVLPVKQVRPTTEAEAEADEHVLPSDDPDTQAIVLDAMGVTPYVPNEADAALVVPAGAVAVEGIFEDEESEGDDEEELDEEEAAAGPERGNSLPYHNLEFENGRRFRPATMRKEETPKQFMQRMEALGKEAELHMAKDVGRSHARPYHETNKVKKYAMRCLHWIWTETNNSDKPHLNVVRGVAKDF